MRRPPRHPCYRRDQFVAALADEVCFAHIALPRRLNGAAGQTHRPWVDHLYALTEPEFTHILSSFPLVPAPVKPAALAVFRAES